MIEYILIYNFLKAHFTEIVDQYFDMKREVLEGRDSNEESLLHRENWIPPMIHISLKKHIQRHMDGIALIYTLPLSAEATPEEMKDVLQEIVYGRLEHWFQAPMCGSVLGKMALNGLNQMGSLSR